jgi:SOS response regulatory protein OraA/RecX
VPDDVVVRCGLHSGLEIDRPLARSLARELRKASALATAERALRSRPLSEERLRRRLDERGVPAAACESAIDTLQRAGQVDDERLARGRASSLAERGWGDAAIVARLTGEGLPGSMVEAAVSALEPEPARAAFLAFGKDPRKAWTLLQRRGFDRETIEATLGGLDEG